MIASEAESTAPAPRLFSPQYLPFAVGAVALVTLGAFENRAVSTALPTIAQEFSAIGSFGVVNAAPTASYVASLAFTGLLADRVGPGRPLRAGIVLFAVAQIVVGTSAGMTMIVAGRLLSGVAEGLIDVGIMVLIARALPADLRPKMFSLFAAAWILPSVVGPFLTGVVTDTIGWRWVFLGALIILGPTWVLIQPALRAAGKDTANARADEPTDSVPGARSIMPWAVTAAAGVFGLTVAGYELEEHTVIAAGAVVVFLGATAVGAVGLLPHGTFRVRRGMPTIVAVRGTAGMAFGAGAWLPLVLTLERGFTPSTAGISLSITGVLWAFGSWLQSREHGLTRVAVLRLGMAVMAAGIAMTSLLVWTSVPVYVGLAGWAIASTGMGLANPTLSVLMLSESDRSNQGRNSSANNMAGSLGFAVSMAVSGTMVAFAAPDPGPVVFGVIIIGSALVALAGAAVGGRVLSR